ncbi:DUF58 domain-containing protein [Leifsonia shinshuensis]|uniref:Uncharacterized protein (DUF58 family) n=1 Tax=Leifsonia shinshuensis TaxID=150026 RepID=A0A853CTE4_9MICO|nr:DUF58 domain-containing protein [Leifsonia shinshuensis]NYJ23957.1 uncharacterized protein (DUF58 family) [Leifsonia shinshuensis]
MSLWSRARMPGPREREEAPAGGSGWALSPGVTAAAIVAMVCLVAAFVMSRVELVLVAAPLLLAAVLGWSSRPQAAGARTSVAIGGDDPDGRVRVDAVAEAEGGVDGVHLRIHRADREPEDAVVTPANAARLRFRVAVSHSGPQRILSIAARGIGPDAAWTGDPGLPAVAERVVRPAAQRVRSLPLPARLLGLTGAHVSSRPGDGGEFRDIDRFRPGDRLRRIDWKATARLAQRPGELYVRRTTATSDAAVQLVIDARDDVPGAVAGWAAPYPRPGATSLDLAREAAVSLAGAYAAASDRVGFDDLSDARRALPPRAGARHLSRVLRAVELTTAHGSATERARAPRLAQGAVVFVLSTFLDDQAMRLALTWRAAGHRVIVVDVLPPRSVAELPARERFALRVVDLERALRLDRLRAAGAELLEWSSPDRDATLRRLATPRRRP